MVANNLQFVVSAKNEASKILANVQNDLKGVKKDTSSVSKAFGAMSSAAKVGGLALAGGVASAGTAIFAMTMKAQEAAAEIDNLSRVAGISSEELQKISFAALDFGVSQEKVSDVLKDVNDRVGDFLTTKAGPMADFFEKIGPQVGVTAENFKDLSSKEALQLYVSSLEKANVSQQEMTFYMEALAGDATSLIPLFKEGGKAMAEQAEEAERLGLILSDTDVALLDAANDATKKAGVGFGALTNQIGVKFSPLISQLTDDFFGMAEEAGGFGEIATKVFNFTIKGAAHLANVIRGIEIVFKAVALAAARQFELVLKSIAFLEEGVRGFLDLIPGVEVSTTSALDGIINKTTELRSAIQTNLHETLMEPLPSGAVEEWAETAVRKHREVAEKTAQIKNESVSQDATRSATALETIRENNELTKEEVIRAELEKDGVLKQHIDQRLAYEKMTGSQRVAHNLGTMSEITKVASSQSKKVFKLQKAASIAQTLISTYDGATSAYKAMAGIPVVGPALGAAAAAAAIASGKANVDQIRAQKFQGQAHDGLEFVPRTGTFLLEQGERVVKKEDNRKLSKAIDNGLGSGELTVNFNISALDSRSATDYIVDNQNIIISIIQNAYTDRGRAGPLG